MTTFSRGQQESENGNERRLRRNRNFSSLGPNRHNLRTLQPRRLYYNTLDIYGSR